MKRIVLFLMAVVVLVALGILLSPLVIGNQIKSNYGKILSQLFPNQKIELKLLSYKRGWYTDNATVQVDLSNSGWKINGQTQIVLQQVIHVGPILRQPNGGYSWQYARIDSQYQQGKTNFQSQVLLDLHKKVVGENKLNQVILSKQQHNSELKQAKLKVTTQPDKKEIQATIDQVTSWSGQKKTVPFFAGTGIKYNKTIVNKASQPETEMAVSLDKLSLGDDPKKVIHASNALIQRKQLTQAGEVTVNYRLYAKHLSIGVMPARTVDLDFTVHNLSLKLLNNLTHDITLFLQPKQTSNQFGIIRDLAFVMSKGLTITINRAFMSTPNGPVLLAGKLNLPASSGIAGMLSPLAKLQANLHGKVPVQWLLAEIMSHQGLKSKKAAMRQVQDWLKNNLLRQEGDEILFSVIYKNGLFYLSTPDHRKLARFYWVKHPQVKSGHSN